MDLIYAAGGKRSAPLDRTTDRPLVLSVSFSFSFSLALATYWTCTAAALALLRLRLGFSVHSSGGDGESSISNMESIPIQSHNLPASGIRSPLLPFFLLPSFLPRSLLLLLLLMLVMLLMLAPASHDDQIMMRSSALQVRRSLALPLLFLVRRSESNARATDLRSLTGLPLSRS